MYERIGPRVGLMCVSRKAASGRKLPSNFIDFVLNECPLLVRADIGGSAETVLSINAVFL
jgi:hypothetical protein